MHESVSYTHLDVYKRQSQKLLDYLKTSSDVLPELMAGKEDPLNLLFPKGEMDVAMAAYHDNIINRIMNGLAKEEIEFLALDNRRTPVSYTHLDVYKRQCESYEAKDFNQGSGL